MQAEIYDMDYNQLVHILGTAHFTKRSLYDAYRAVGKLKPTDLAIELDVKRYQVLNSECATCPQNKGCTRKCEFIGAVEALENRDTNIWLIDMSRPEFIHRMRTLQPLYSHWRVLIDERNALMAARLAWIASRGLKEEKNPTILALVGAAHVDGIKGLLQNPLAIKENLQKLGLSFTPPALIRRISVN